MKRSAGPVAKGGLPDALWQPILKTSFAGRLMKILVIEDDRQTAQYLAKGLRQQEHAVEVANNGRDGLFLAAGEKCDVMIVNRIPGLDGLGVVKTVRGAGVKTPVLALKTLGGIDDRVEGLEAGGDDYLVKPLAFAEFMARINALARRPPLRMLRRHSGSLTLRWIS